MYKMMAIDTLKTAKSKKGDITLQHIDNLGDVFWFRNVPFCLFSASCAISFIETAVFFVYVYL